MRTWGLPHRGAPCASLRCSRQGPRSSSSATSSATSSAWAVSAGRTLPSPPDDYRSGHLGVGAELRRWLWRTGWADDLGGARLGGLFAALRLDASAGRTWAADGRALGDELQLEPTVQVGYRFCPWLRFELTPALGLGVSTRFDLSGRLAPRTRWHQLLGLTVGWAF